MIVILFLLSNYKGIKTIINLFIYNYKCIITLSIGYEIYKYLIKSNGVINMEINYAQMGRRIANRRKVLNMTQDDVAESTGLSNNHISNIENNHSIPSIETLMKVCEALDATPDYFLLGTLRRADNALHSGIHEKIKLCDEKKLKLIDSFITWVIDEKI